jgi:hypothetical protein
MLQATTRMRRIDAWRADGNSQSDRQDLRKKTESRQPKVRHRKIAHEMHVRYRYSKQYTHVAHRQRCSVGARLSDVRGSRPIGACPEVLSMQGNKLDPVLGIALL